MKKVEAMDVTTQAVPPRHTNLDRNTTLDLEVRTGTLLIWQGKARSVSSVNSSGPFDILPYHANFITLVKKNKISFVDERGSVHDHQFMQAVIYVENNKVKIYADFT